MTGADAEAAVAADQRSPNLPVRRGVPRNMSQVSAKDLRSALDRVRAAVPDERTARAVWARLVEPEDEQVCQLIGRSGAWEALETLDPQNVIAERIFPRLTDLDPGGEARILSALGARLVIPGDDEWPPGLDDTRFPPLCLWVRGGAILAEACERSVALVGARSATGYGIHVARELGAGLADRGFAVVSGAAYGIDAAAHEGALGVDGTTVAVLACGVDRPYPAGHAGLIARIAESGAVVSEVPPGSAPTRWRFLSRNRLIAAFTQGTVVVEAGLRSGSRNTARHAADLNRHVAAVPGPVTSAVSAGCHELVRGGAVLVTDAAEVAELVGRMGELAPVRQDPAEQADTLDPVVRRVLDAVPYRGGVDAASVAARAGCRIDAVRGALGVLGMEGLVIQRSGVWFKAPKPRERRNDKARQL